MIVSWRIQRSMLCCPFLIFRITFAIFPIFLPIIKNLEYVSDKLFYCSKLEQQNESVYEIVEIIHVVEGYLHNFLRKLLCIQQIY